MKKRLARVVALGLTLAMFAGYAYSSQAAPITSESIQEKEEQIEQAEEERDRLQASLTNAQEIKESLESQKNDLNTYITELDRELATIIENIETLETQIAEKEAEIELTQAELETAKETEAEQYANMVERIQYIYEHGEESYIEILFSGTSFSDMLNRVEYLEQISAYDQKMLEQYILNRQMIELLEQQLLTDKALLEESKAGKESEQAALEELIAAKEQTILEYENDIANKEQAIAQYEADIQEETEIIEALEAAIAEEKKKLLEQNRIYYDGGQFKFPVAYYTRLSSEYGWRMHPTLHVEKFHNGIDLASPTGTDIYAAYDGKVVAAAYSSSMGNYVMIDHGDELYTIYMHASKLYVSAGDIVVKGETIAAVGSTGRSTGPHLHFGVRLNGQYVSPWNYLSQ
ncbi:MAG: peptidoglycan DD-metalloendopeptidase family protein [Lachnospiraceae bacterium]|nr:peptidoglycan DD-metalloendopeptidase family protein [Lachnospiraceae bacterium]MBQ7782177.1 peptidoglycan DD-metalloendopeptidase family protein [Lachnospiraceae bacterium]